MRFLQGSNQDRRIGFVILGVMLVLILGVSILAPASGDSDPTPTTYNSGTAGTKAVYLLMDEIGYKAQRWDSPPGDLRNIDAAQTTLVLADPDFPSEEAKQVQAEVADFLTRGGRVLATGRSGAYLLPGGRTANPKQILKTICHTRPEDASLRSSDPLALAGSVSIDDEVGWDTAVTSIHDAANHANPVTVGLRCGPDAVVVSFYYGAGEAIWWSSPMPLTNGGLKEDASLKLLLASLAAPGTSDQPSAGRRPTILFDEYFHGQRGSLWDTAKGLPLSQLAWQCGLVGVLLVLSFGRRSGPLRMPVRLPRTSPVEFAESMGRLYRVAGATSAATDGARRRLLQFLGARCGVPREILRAAAPDAIVESLQTRFGGDWSRLGEHLTQAAEAGYAVLAPRSALDLVRALDRDRRDLAAAAGAARPNLRASAASEFPAA